MKTPEERGPIAAWAYQARVALNLSPEQTVDLLGRYNPATIRKAETNDRHMGRPLWRALTGLYPRIAHERGITIPQPPGAFMDTSGRGATPSLDLSAYLKRIDDLVTQMTEDRKLIRELLDRLTSKPDPTPPDVLKVIGESRAQAQSESTLRPADPTPDRGRSSQALSAG